LKRLRVFSGFVNIISTFSYSTRTTLASHFRLSSFYGRIFEDEHKHRSQHITPLFISSTNIIIVLEIGYHLLHTERNGRDHHPFSIRQMAVYQKYNFSITTSDCILVQPSLQVRKRIADLLTDGGMAKLPDHWTFIHEVYLGSLSHNWQSCISWNDKMFSEVVSHFSILEYEIPDTDLLRGLIISFCSWELWTLNDLIWTT
jgi:hypothetical protein